MLGCNFTNNHALGLVDEDARNVHQYVDINGKKVMGGSGGAIAWVGNVGLVDGCDFADNSAAKLGGAIFLRDNYDTSIANSHFTNNAAGINGGAVDFNRGAQNGTIINSTFENNRANRSAGAVFWFGTNGTIKNSNFTNNTALGIVSYPDSYGNVTYGGYSGAVMWTGAQGVVDNCRFENNYAQYNEATKSGGRGGAVYLQGSDEGNGHDTAFTNSVFIGNVAGYNGGGINWFRGAANGLVENSTFINNAAHRSGGGVYWSGVNGTIKGSIFTDNTALAQITDANGGGDGGAVLWVGPKGFINGSTFTDNRAAYSGGGMYLKGSDNGTDDLCNEVYISDCVFEDNVAGLNGGALVFQRGAFNCSISTSHFDNNTAWRNGGAVFWYGRYGDMLNCDFTNNHALGLVDEDARNVHQYVDSIGRKVLGGSGGAVAWVGNVGLVDGCDFTNNSGTWRGGAIFLRDNVNTTFANSIFTNNTACQGGAIYWRSDSSEELVKCILIGNAANKGSAIYLEHEGLEIIDSVLLDNRADAVELKLNTSRSDDNTTMEIIAEFKGNDNLINAIWDDGNVIGLTNVTYLGVNGITNTGATRKVPVKLADDVKPTDADEIYQTQYEAGQNITFYIYDAKNRLLAAHSELTNISGMVKYAYVNDTNKDKLYEFVFHPEDNYYTGIENSTSKGIVDIEIPVTDIYYLENESFIIKIIPRKASIGIPTENVTVYVNDELIGIFPLTMQRPHKSLWQVLNAENIMFM